MSFSKITKDMNIIAALDDSPALSSSELKAKFDEGGKEIKEFINNTLIPELEKSLDEKQSAVILCRDAPSGGNDGDIILVYEG